MLQLEANMESIENLMQDPRKKQKISGGYEETFGPIYSFQNEELFKVCEKPGFPFLENYSNDNTLNYNYFDDYDKYNYNVITPPKYSQQNYFNFYDYNELNYNQFSSVFQKIPEMNKSFELENIPQDDKHDFNQQYKDQTESIQVQTQNALFENNDNDLFSIITVNHPCSADNFQNKLNKFIEETQYNDLLSLQETQFNNSFKFQKEYTIKNTYFYKCNDFNLAKSMDFNPNNKLNYVGTIQTSLSTNFTKFGYINETNTYKGDLLPGQKLEVFFSDFTNFKDLVNSGNNIVSKMNTFIKCNNQYVGLINHSYSQIWCYLLKQKKIQITPYFAYKDSNTVHVFIDIDIRPSFFADLKIHQNQENQAVQQETSNKYEEYMKNVDKEATEILLNLMSIKLKKPSYFAQQEDFLFFSKFKLFHPSYTQSFPKLVICCQQQKSYYQEDLKRYPNKYTDVYSIIEDFENNQIKEYYNQQKFLEETEVIPLDQNYPQSLEMYFNTSIKQNEDEDREILLKNNLKNNSVKAQNSSVSIFNYYDYHPTPSTLKTQLHPYQQQGLQWLLYRENRINNLFLKQKSDLEVSTKLQDFQYEEYELPCGYKIYRNDITGEMRSSFVQIQDFYGGILADEMGMGKTLMCIALIHQTIQQKSSKYGTLIVTPPNLVNQWEDQIKLHSHLNSISVLNLQDKKNRFLNLENYDIVICSYNNLSTLYEDENTRNLLYSQEWSRIILDEAQKIKNRKSKTAKACLELKSQYRWCLTGTPIENNIDELFSLIHFLKVPVYGLWSWWQSNIKKSISKNKQIKLIHLIIKNLILRRTKKTQDLNGQEIVKLPKKHVQNIEIELFENEKLTYNQIYLESQAFYKYLNTISKSEKNSMHIFQIISKLRQFCVHPSLVFTKIEIDEEQLQNQTDSDNIVQKIEQFLKQIQEKTQKKLEELKQKQQQQSNVSNHNNQIEIESDKSSSLQNSDKQNWKYKEEVIRQIKEGKYEKCQICLEDIKYHSISSCLHVFCSACFKNSIKHKKECPMCRKHLEINDILDLVDEDAQLSINLKDYNNQEILTGSKIQKVIELIEQIHAKGEKVVLFSQWLGTLDILQNHLNMRQIAYQRYDGKLNKTQKKQSLKSFDIFKPLQLPLSTQAPINQQDYVESSEMISEEVQEDIIDNDQQNEANPTVLLASLKSGYVGLNLVGANHLILCDSWWNPAVEDQAIERVYRIGQEKETYIYRIICKDTIEEKIQILLEEKRKIFQQVMKVEKSDGNQMSIKDFNFIFN